MEGFAMKATVDAITTGIRSQWMTHRLENGSRRRLDQGL